MIQNAACRSSSALLSNRLSSSSNNGKKSKNFFDFLKFCPQFGKTFVFSVCGELGEGRG